MGMVRGARCAVVAFLAALCSACADPLPTVATTREMNVSVARETAQEIASQRECELLGYQGTGDDIGNAPIQCEGGSYVFEITQAHIHDREWVFYEGAVRFEYSEQLLVKLRYVASGNVNPQYHVNPGYYLKPVIKGEDTK